MSNGINSYLKDAFSVIFTAEDRESLRSMAARTAICIAIAIFGTILHLIGEHILKHYLPEALVFIWTSITILIFVADIFLLLEGIVAEIRKRLPAGDALPRAPLILAIGAALLLGIAFGQPVRQWTLHLVEAAASALARSAKAASETTKLPSEGVANGSE